VPLITDYRHCTEDQNIIIDNMKRNLGQKRGIEQQYQSLEAEIQSYQKEVAEAGDYCRGSFEEPEYRRRKAYCQAKQIELDNLQQALEKRRVDLDARDAERRKEAQELKTRYDDLGQRVKIIEEKMANLPLVGEIAARCRRQSDRKNVAKCLTDGWKVADAQLRLYLDLQTGDAFRDGDTLRKAAKESAWPLLDRIQIALAVFLGELGRFREGAALIAQVKTRQISERLLHAMEHRLIQLGKQQASLPGVSPQAKAITDELRISHLSMQGRAAVMLGLLNYREGRYQGSLIYFTEAQKRHPEDQGIRDLIFLVAQAELSRQELAKEKNPAADGPARIFQREGAIAATKLGLFLIDCNQALQAEAALGLARERIFYTLKSKNWSWEVGDLHVTDGLIRKVRQEGTGDMAKPPGQRYFDTMTKADLMLDALQYGQKSWNRSLRFLEIARSADPYNPVILEAYNELSLIAARTGQE